MGNGTRVVVEHVLAPGLIIVRGHTTSWPVCPEIVAYSRDSFWRGMRCSRWITVTLVTPFSPYLL